MKNMKSLAAIAFSALMFLAACNNGTDNTKGGTSGSETQTTENDSSGAESRSSMGVDADNQKEQKGYPANQSNLNSDSTARKHDNDTLRKK